MPQITINTECLPRARHSTGAWGPKTPSLCSHEQPLGRTVPSCHPLHSLLTAGTGFELCAPPGPSWIPGFPRSRGLPVQEPHPTILAPPWTSPSLFFLTSSLTLEYVLNPERPPVSWLYPLYQSPPGLSFWPTDSEPCSRILLTLSSNPQFPGITILLKRPTTKY